LHACRNNILFKIRSAHAKSQIELFDINLPLAEATIVKQ